MAENLKVSTLKLLPYGSRRHGTRRSTAAVALDIAADAVVALQPTGDGGDVRNAIVHPLPTGLVVDGEVVDSDGLAAELRTLFSEHKLPLDVRVGLAHPRLMVRLVELPAAIAGRDLDNAVRHLATDHLPVGLDQLVVDYRRVGQVPSSGANAMQRILMAAARVDGIDRLTRAIEGAGLHLQGIGLSGLAMVSALEHPVVRGEAILYVQVGALTNVVITEDGEPLLVRAASAGSESIAARLAERARISHEEARGHVATLGLGVAPPADSAAPISGDLQAKVYQQVREGLRRVVAEVQSSRGVYAARPDACPIGAVVLTGSMLTWPGVAQALEQDLHLPIIVADRTSWPRLGDVAVPAERLDVVVGLARTNSDDRPNLRPAAVSAGRERTPATRVAQIAYATVALLAVGIVYLAVLASQISSGHEQLARLSTDVVSAEREVAALKPYDTFEKATVARRDAVASVAGTRFNWDRTFTELAEVAPAGVWLTSVKATLSPTTVVEGGAVDAPTGSLRGALAAPALELSGCARREALVPAYIDRLQAMTGVTDVAFSRSERTDKDAGSTSTTTGSNSSAGIGDCRNGDSRTARFALVAYFEAGASQAAATGTAAAPQAQAPTTAGTAAQTAANPTTSTATPPATGTNGGSR